MADSNGIYSDHRAPEAKNAGWPRSVTGALSREVVEIEPLGTPRSGD